MKWVKPGKMGKLCVWGGWRERWVAQAETVQGARRERENEIWEGREVENLMIHLEELRQSFNCRSQKRITHYTDSDYTVHTIHILHSIQRIVLLVYTLRLKNVRYTLRWKSAIRVCDTFTHMATGKRVSTVKHITVIEREGAACDIF